MSLFSETMGFTRQNLYKTYVHGPEARLARTERLKAALEQIVSEHPGWSGSMIHKELSLRGIKVGKDKFYSLVRRYQLTLNARRKFRRHRSYKLKAAPSLVYNRTFHRVFEVLFADYTEIETQEGKLQLLLVEDLISRYITASRVSKTCTAAPVLSALVESIELKESLGLKYQTIVHTDRGSEFVNHAVRNLAEENNVLLSNTGRHRCYENPYMERLNGTLKHSLGLRVRFSSRAEASTHINDAIERYNQEHRHSSLGKRVPYIILTSYTGKKSRKPQVKTDACPLPGQGARIYSKALTVKVKKIDIDNNKKHPK